MLSFTGDAPLRKVAEASEGRKNRQGDGAVLNWFQALSRQHSAFRRKIDKAPKSKLLDSEAAG
jgi:hypothetical protein